MQPTRIDLHLRFRVKPGMRDAYFAFLAEGKPFYESPGGIEVRLLQDLADDHRFIELILYENREVYDRDQVRVKDDPTMKAFLKRWRELLVEPPAVEVYALVAIPEPPARAAG
ncbi:MAG: hypothetical protein QM783_02205 [Phycisphaerales bacterium]